MTLVYLHFFVFTGVTFEKQKRWPIYTQVSLPNWRTAASPNQDHHLRKGSSNSTCCARCHTNYVCLCFPPHVLSLWQCNTSTVNRLETSKPNRGNYFEYYMMMKCVLHPATILQICRALLKTNQFKLLVAKNCFMCFHIIGFQPHLK